ncbi:MAG: MFS transporter [Clostridia bacterium]|nr:MFS transporter [Clostridia bacterium]
MRLTHRSTILACYNGYVTQAICINLAPLLYLTFQSAFGLSVGAISSLIAVNFATQLLIDVLASRFSHRMNLRLFAVLAHVLAALGLIGLSLFPYLLPPYVGLLAAVALLGMGGGFTEVLISPLLEACPTEGKSGNMSLLHSFYCWGQAGVVLFSGVFFAVFEIGNAWRYLPLVWTVIPLLGAVAFCVVPIYRLPADEKGGGSLRTLLRRPLFLCFLCMMLCAGAGEMIMSQWSSAFAESALGVNKTLGDLLGPCMFALMMGSARALYGTFSARLNLRRLMMIGCVGCACAYLLAAFAPHPILALAGCALCGFSVGIFWPGILSRAAEALPMGGISMFALLALAGDLGCLAGPSIAGTLADAMGGDLRWAFGFAVLFPLAFFTILLLQRKRKRERLR